MRIAVDRNVYRAGDLVTGRIFVTIREPIRSDTLSFSIIGEEIAQWMQSGDHLSQYHEFLKHEILTTVLPDPYMPGEYMYPFEYPLADDLPGVLDADCLFGSVDSLHATIKYTLKARIRVEGRFVTDLEAQFSLIVRARENLPSRMSAVERTISKKIRALNVVNRGTCHLAAAMPKNVYTIGESARVDCFVNNHTSSVGVRQVKCRLYQDVTLKLPSGVTRKCTRLLSQVKCPGPRSGDLLERPMQLAIAGKVRYPTTVGHFLSCEYRISIECDLMWRTSLSVDFPVIIVAGDANQSPMTAAYSSPPSYPRTSMAQRQESFLHGPTSMSQRPSMNQRQGSFMQGPPSMSQRPPSMAYRQSGVAYPPSQ
ncbi:hypothetical protein PINS_up000667 [Pythium insidiosum]|nr:hypothetical protein PINS_up000667 [Pythium insidiosum]